MAEVAPQTRIVAHRGFWHATAPNTLASAQAAIDAGADGIECDVRLTADGAVVVIHDEFVELATNRKVPVKSLTLTELQSLDVGAGERVPTLAELLLVIDGRCSLIIELKVEYSYTYMLWALLAWHRCVEGLAEKVHSVVTSAGAEHWCSASSFSLRYLDELRQAGSRMDLDFLTFPFVFSLSHRRLRELPEYLHSITCHYVDCNDSLVKAAHARGLRVGVWTVNRERTMASCITNGADWIITDAVGAAFTVRAAVT